MSTNKYVVYFEIQKSNDSVVTDLRPQECEFSLGQNVS